MAAGAEKRRYVRRAERRYPDRVCGRPIVISSVEYVPCSPEQERRILDLCRAAHVASGLRLWAEPRAVAGPQIYF